MSAPSPQRRMRQRLRRDCKRNQARPLRAKTPRVLQLDDASRLAFELIQRATQYAQPISAELARAVARIGIVALDQRLICECLNVASRAAMLICPYGDARLHSKRASAHCAITSGVAALSAALHSQVQPPHETMHLAFASQFAHAMIAYLISAAPDPQAEREWIRRRMAQVSGREATPEQLRVCELARQAIVESAAPLLVNSKGLGLS